MTTDTTEKGLESYITSHLVEKNGYILRNYVEYDREYCLDTHLLISFLEATQKNELERLKRIHGESYRYKIARRLTNLIRAKGVIEILRKGIVDNGVNCEVL